MRVTADTTQVLASMGVDPAIRAQFASMGPEGEAFLLALLMQAPSAVAPAPPPAPKAEPPAPEGLGYAAPPPGIPRHIAAAIMAQGGGGGGGHHGGFGGSPPLTATNSGGGSAISGLQPDHLASQLPPPPASLQAAQQQLQVWTELAPCYRACAKCQPCRHRPSCSCLKCRGANSMYVTGSCSLFFSKRTASPSHCLSCARKIVTTTPFVCQRLSTSLASQQVAEAVQAAMLQQQLASLPPQQAQQLLLMLLAGGGASLGPGAQQALLSSLGLPHGAVAGPGPLQVDTSRHVRVMSSSLDRVMSLRSAMHIEIQSRLPPHYSISLLHFWCKVPCVANPVRSCMFIESLSDRGLIQACVPQGLDPALAQSLSMAAQVQHMQQQQHLQAQLQIQQQQQQQQQQEQHLAQQREQQERLQQQQQQQQQHRRSPERPLSDAPRLNGVQVWNMFSLILFFAV